MQKCSRNRDSTWKQYCSGIHLVMTCDHPIGCDDWQVLDTSLMLDLLPVFRCIFPDSARRISSTCPVCIPSPSLTSNRYFLNEILKFGTGRNVCRCIYYCYAGTTTTDGTRDTRISRYSIGVRYQPLGCDSSQDRPAMLDHTQRETPKMKCVADYRKQTYIWWHLCRGGNASRLIYTTSGC